MSAEAKNRRVHLRITGLVQGVFFRAYTRDEARRLGLRGWVRNLPDGSVEAVAEGAEEALQRLVRWCHSGSPSSAVEGVEEEWSEPTGEHQRFDVRY